MQRERRHDGERGGLTGGAVLVTLGLVFLVRQFVDFSRWDAIAWPFFIIVPGLLLFGAMFVGGRGNGRLAIPASIVLTIGLILLMQSIFNRFDTWAYAWALIPTAAGSGTFIAGLWDESAAQVQAGTRIALAGLALFLVFGTLFEVVLFRGLTFAGFGWPLVLIGVGMFLLFRRSTARD